MVVVVGGGRGVVVVNVAGVSKVLTVQRTGVTKIGQVSLGGGGLFYYKVII